MDQPPMVAEQRLATELQAGLDAYLDRVRTFMPTTTAQAPAQALRLIQVMHEAEAFIERFARAAESLRREGFPALGDRVLAASRDVTQAKGQYLQMYTGAVANLALMDQMRAQAEQYAVQQLLAGAYHQQAVYEKSMRGVHAAQTYTCQACGIYFGDAFVYFSFCPNCGVAM